MEIEIKIKDNTYDEISTLMKNIKKLNDGNEIGGWLLGDWTINEDNKATLLLDEFIIPKQEVSGGEVDIDPSSMTDMIKEFGIQKCNRLKAHWHIHPFGNGKTDWSSIDEEKIKDFMEPKKDREIFVFLLSSEDSIKARVELNTKTTILKKSFNIKKSYDNLDVERESSTDNSIFTKLKNRIKDKVSTSSVIYGKDWQKDEGYNKFYKTATNNNRYKKEKSKYEKPVWQVIRNHKLVILNTDLDFGEFMFGYTYGDEKISKYDTINMEKNGYKMKYLFTKTIEAEKFEKLLKSQLFIAEEDYSLESIEKLNDKESEEEVEFKEEAYEGINYMYE